jgi:hypothetical protein
MTTCAFFYNYLLTYFDNDNIDKCVIIFITLNCMNNSSYKNPIVLDADDDEEDTVTWQSLIGEF